MTRCQALRAASASGGIAEDFIFVSGALGTKPGTMELVEGGTGPETTQALKTIAAILEASGATLADSLRYLAPVPGPTLA